VMQHDPDVSDEPGARNELSKDREGVYARPS